MIRIVVGLAATAALLSAALVMAFDRPPLQPALSAGSDVEVTRADASNLVADAAALRQTAISLGAISAPAQAASAQSLDDRAPAVPGDTVLPRTTGDLRHALIEAIAEGRSDAEIGAIISAAREVPGIRVPESLVTARGLVHTASFDAARAATHTVAAGDTLRSIAERHYGTPTSWTRIVEANASTFARNGQLTVGQILILPE